MSQSHAGSRAAFALAMRIVVVAALAVSAYAHFSLAKSYDPVGDHITQGALFRFQGALAGFSAMWLVFDERVAGWLPAIMVAGGSLTAVLVYRYINIGEIGPLPNMYEPIWQSMNNLKVISAVAEGIATVGGAFGLLHASLR